MRKQITYIGLIVALILGGCRDSQKEGTSREDKDLRATEQMAAGTADSATPGPQPTISAQAKPEALIPMYEVVDQDTYDAPIKTQIELHAVVSGTFTELGLKQLLQKLYDEANATRDFKYHEGKPTHVFIYLYTSQDHFKSGMGQWIAMLSKVGEDSQIQTQVKTELIAQLDAKPEVKHGLSESKRKEIFRALVTAEDRAHADAQRMYPLPDPSKPGYSQAKASEQVKKQAQAVNTLREKYELEVAKRFGLTQEQLKDISIEGLMKDWPMP
jgi:hypothetical protein